MLKHLLKLIEEKGGSWSVNKKLNRPLNIDQIIVSVDDFFDGIEDNQDFATNTGEGNQVFHQLFQEIKNKKVVQDVWIAIYDYDPDEDEWPYAETCYISTTASKEEVFQWFPGNTFPSDIQLQDLDGNPLKYLPPIDANHRVFCCWWD